MKRIITIFTLLFTLLNPLTAVASERFGLGFDYLKMNYQFNEEINQDLDLKQLRGSLEISPNSKLELDYRFGGYSNYTNSDFKAYNLNLIRDFTLNEKTDFSLGLGAGYSNYQTNFFNQKLFNIESMKGNVLIGVDRELTDRISLFLDGAYGLAGEHEVQSPFLEDIEEIAGDTISDYNINQDYSLNAGLMFDLAEDLQARVGYHVGVESIKNKNFSVDIDTDDGVIDNTYNITDIDRLTQSVFVGVETRF